MSGLLVDWDWQLDKFKPPFSVRGDEIHAVMRKFKTRTGSLWWVVCKASNCPDDQLDTVMENLLILVQMRYEGETQ